MSEISAISSEVVRDFAKSFVEQLQNENAENDYIQLQRMANELLMEAKKYNMEDFSKSALWKKINSLSENNIETKSNEIINKENQKQDYYFKTLYKIAFKFDDYLTKFLKVQPKAALFVKETEQGLETYELTMNELAELADQKGSLKQENLTEEYKKNIKESLIDKKHAEYSLASYVGTSNRLNRFFEVVKARRKQNGILLFKQNSHWIGARVLNKGDLKEAYVSLLLSSHKEKLQCSLETYPEGTNPYYSHELISYFFYNYVKKVTNLAAIIQEDVATKDKQYAVKGTGASLPGLNQYIKMAEFIRFTSFDAISKFDEKGILDILQTMKLHQDTERNIELFTVDTAEDLTDAVVSLSGGSNISKALRSKAKTDKGIQKRAINIIAEVDY